MAGWGECPCCKEWAMLTEHHAKEVGNEKVMVCRECHNVIEEYRKLIDKFKSK